MWSSFIRYAAKTIGMRGELDKGLGATIYTLPCGWRFCSHGKRKKEKCDSRDIVEWPSNGWLLAVKSGWSSLVHFPAFDASLSQRESELNRMAI